MAVEGGVPRAPPPALALPSLGVVVSVFHRSRFYREALRSIAGQVGDLPEVEIVVVRSPDVTIEVPSDLNTRRWNCQVVRSEAIGEGPFLADGLGALSADFVVPLDDDDLWAPHRLATVSRTLAAHPRAVYYHNGQSFIDADGGAVPDGVARRHLRRFAGVPSGSPKEVAPERLRRRPGSVARWGSTFNNSSVALRRTVLEAVASDLRATSRLIDSFMFYAGAAGNGSLIFDPTALTRYRIHTWNRSRGPRTLGPFEVAEPSQTREGRLASLSAMRTMVERQGAPWLVPWVERDRAYFDLLEGLREGEADRLRTVRRAVHLARYLRYEDPLMNALLAATAGGLVAAPKLAHRTYWSGTSRPSGSHVGPDAPSPPPRTP